MSHGIAAALLLAAVPGARSDEVQLRGGGRVEGLIVQKTAQALVIETGPGRVTIPASRVERIVPGRSSLETWRERSAALHPGDFRAWMSLARWAEDAGLTTQAREAWQRVLASEPDNPDAHRALGHVRQGGTWMSEDEWFRARGYVHAGDRWMAPAEYEASLRAQAEEDAARRERMDEQLRLREAEARAREAEARASEAEAGGYDTGGGLWWGYPYGYPYGHGGYGHRDGNRRDQGRHDGRGGGGGHENGGNGQLGPHPAPHAPANQPAPKPAQAPRAAPVIVRSAPATMPPAR